MTEKKNWRTPAVVVACSGLAMTIVLGTRHGFGLYLQPMTLDLGISRETFAFAIALQNLFYGFSQPLTGMIADKFGAARVMAAGTIAYAIGLVLMSHSTTGMELNLSAGLLIGMAMGCCGFSTVYGVVGRVVPAEKRSTAMGVVGAAGSLGQFETVDALLAKQEYMAGKAFSMGDIPMGVAAYRWYGMMIERPALKHLDAWYARLCVRPAFREYCMLPLT